MTVLPDAAPPGAVNDEHRVIDSGGNIFADLGLELGEEDLLKIKIAHAISNAITKRSLTQEQAGKIIGADQAKVSALVRGRLDGFGVDRLFRYLLLLGKDVDITISQRYRSGEKGRLRVKAA